MARVIKGNRDGKNGHNDSYTIPGRGIVSRSKLVKEIKTEGRHPNHTTINVDGVDYVKAKPDNKKPNNVN